jgi:hypothetical protein
MLLPTRDITNTQIVNYNISVFTIPVIRPGFYLMIYLLSYSSYIIRYDEDNRFIFFSVISIADAVVF